MADKHELVVRDESIPIMDTARFAQMQRVARVLAFGSLTPRHLVVPGNAEATIANCVRIANQAIRWGFDPFAVADASYVVSGKLGFEGKLVAAVCNARANLKGRLRYEFEGTGDGLTITVIGQFADEDFERTVTLSVGQAKTSNKMWTLDPQQKLVYSGTIRWARRHCPEVVMGVLTDDDLEKIKADAMGESPEQKTLDDLAREVEKHAHAETIDVKPHAEQGVDLAAMTAGNESPEEASAQDAAQTVTEQTPPLGIDLEDAQAELEGYRSIGECTDFEIYLLPLCADDGQRETLHSLVDRRKQAIRDSRGAKATA